MAKDRDEPVVERLDKIISLLQHLVALQLAEKGLSHQAIGKHIHVAKASVGKLLRGIERD